MGVIEVNRRMLGVYLEDGRRVIKRLAQEITKHETCKVV